MLANIARVGVVARHIVLAQRATTGRKIVNQFGKAQINLMIARQINTTDKQKDHHHIEVYDPEWINAKKPRGPQTAEEFADVSTQKNWISYGFDHVDKDNDRLSFHTAMFCFVTCGFMVFSYMLLYFPDYNLNDWALREAFMELDRREKAGLPLISPDLVDPAKIQLPTDEELGDYKVFL